MKEKQDAMKLELLVTLNDNIVIQRYFNVREFNEMAKNSLELDGSLINICDIIQHQLWVKSGDYMTENAESIMRDPSVMDTSKTDGPEWFKVSIKIGEQTICQRGFDAKPYPPKARYTVDIRPDIKSVLSELTDIFSGEKYSTRYMEYDLV
jgi:hypothetical protein